ncbi:hypothetical protein [Lacticaseibacillus sharpeae]|uniref:hypothetical protein n=1 Tax=Lacticaseibacillus sharpeae TaxID=1626 RepID=UPI0006CF466B|nr:hypothetical protein [Lacticaseibacillus sharpeae]
MTDLTLLNYDGNPDAVINPFRDEGFVFPDRMLFAFITEENVARFVAQYPHTVSGTFETVSNVFTVYTLNVEGTDIGICRAPLGAAAAVQLLEFLIAYGAKHIIASVRAACSRIPQRMSFWWWLRRCGTKEHPSTIYPQPQT